MSKIPDPVNAYAYLARSKGTAGISPKGIYVEGVSWWSDFQRSFNMSVWYASYIGEVVSQCKPGHVFSSAPIDR